MTKLLVLQCAVIMALLFALTGCEPQCTAPRHIVVATAQERHLMHVITLDTCQGVVKEQIVGTPPQVVKPVPPLGPKREGI